MGSGLGLLLEGLWGVYCSEEIASAGMEITWLADNHYNDYACVEATSTWSPATPVGELLRVEAKTMNLDADESKGHFDQPHDLIGEHDLLVVLLWRWVRIRESRYCPRITDHFVGNARRIALLRDALHRARGGSFVEAGTCGDHRGLARCQHVGEPLNASGIRERRTGPESNRGTNASYAANFGGLVRMLKCGNSDAQKALREVRQADDVAHAFISFIHKNLPQEEVSSFGIKEWREIYSETLDANGKGMSKLEIRTALADARPDYQTILRLIQ